MSIDQDFDCLHFRGDKPCKPSGGRSCGPLLQRDPRKRKGLCSQYTPTGKKVLIIKLGALGDVLRTTSLIPAFRKEYPDAAISWITLPGAVPLLEGSGLQRILPWGPDSVIWAGNSEWDIVVSLDKEEGPTALASSVRSQRKFGFGRNRNGLLTPLSQAGEELFLLGIDDERKFRQNAKTYPRLIAEACQLPWNPNPYHLPLFPEEREWAVRFSGSWKSGPRVGLNIGAGEAFAGKQWAVDKFVALAERICEAGAVPVFLGGRKEASLYESLKDRFAFPAVFPGCLFSLREFAALVSTLNLMVSGDSLAMHMAISQGVWSVALFGSTTEREIEFYGRGEAIVGKADCAPCYRRVCPRSEECLSGIEVDQVFPAVLRGIRSSGAQVRGIGGKG